MQKDKLIELLLEENKGVNLSYDKYLNIATSFIDTLNNTQLNYFKILLNVDLEEEEITDLKSDIYSYIINKMCDIK